MDLQTSLDSREYAKQLKHYKRAPLRTGVFAVVVVVVVVCALILSMNMQY